MNIVSLSVRGRKSGDISVWREVLFRYKMGQHLLHLLAYIIRLPSHLVD